jgi:predicted kinase
MKYLILLRGLPGSGKSTVAELISENGKYSICCADDYFIQNGKYCFDATKLGDAHSRCQRKVEFGMALRAQKIILANTSTTEKELEPYFKLAEKYDYKIISLIVENRNGNTNVHGISDEQLQKMKNRFNIKL